MYRIVVPLSLRRKKIIIMHTSPVAGHMGDYRTLYRISLRSFWLRMRNDIKEWIQQYPNCILTRRWHRRGQELMFSWPISSPFTIFHVDLWSPGHMADHNIALMNTMCEMTQFVVVVPVPDEI